MIVIKKKLGRKYQYGEGYLFIPSSTDGEIFLEYLADAIKAYSKPFFTGGDPTKLVVQKRATHDKD